MVSIHEVLSRLLRNPLLKDISIEQAVQYAVDYMHIIGSPSLFKEGEVLLDVKDFRAELPCDFVSVIQVKDMNTGTCLRSCSDNFQTREDGCSSDMTFKIQGRFIFTSFKDRQILVSYRSIPLDENGFPLLIDNPVFLKALELYIKKERYSMLFDMGQIQAQSLAFAQRDYAWAAGQLQSELNTPDVNEMETIRRIMTGPYQNTRHFYNGFKYLGAEQELKRH